MIESPADPRIHRHIGQIGCRKIGVQRHQLQADESTTAPITLRLRSAHEREHGVALRPSSARSFHVSGELLPLAGERMSACA